MSNQLFANQLPLGQLTATDQRLAELQKHVEQISSDLAHDLRGPLQTVSGYAYFLAKEEAGPLSEEQRQFVRHIQTGARGILKVIASCQERLNAIVQSKAKPS